MKLSKKGIDFICGFESYKEAQPDGSCKAYRCIAGVLTCGWGCTVGVTENTHWTREEADRRYAAELAKFEKDVERLVKVQINQNQFDALVSFAYNCGEGALGSSTLLKRLNKGDYAGACKGFAAWDKANVYDKKLKRRVKRTVRGLTRRRSEEAAMFATKMAPENHPEDAAPPADDMPQEVAAPSPEMSKPMMLGMGATAATAIPAAPSLDSFTGWKSFGETAQSLFTWATASPFLVGGVLVVVTGIWAGPWMLTKIRGTS